MHAKKNRFTSGIKTIARTMPRIPSGLFRYSLILYMNSLPTITYIFASPYSAYLLQATITWLYLAIKPYYFALSHWISSTAEFIRGAFNSFFYDRIALSPLILIINVFTKYANDDSIIKAISTFCLFRRSNITCPSLSLYIFKAVCIKNLSLYFT